MNASQLYTETRKKYPASKHLKGTGWIYQLNGKDFAGPFDTEEKSEAHRLDRIVSEMAKLVEMKGGLDYVFMSRGNYPRCLQDSIMRAWRARPREVPGDLPEIELSPEDQKAWDAVPRPPFVHRYPPPRGTKPEDLPDIDAFP